MSNTNHGLCMGEAASRFLASLVPEEKEINQLAVYKFAHWYGLERPLDGLTAHAVANYAERLSLSDAEYIKKVGLIRAFLAYTKKEGWSRTNLATHLKAKKGKSKSQFSAKQSLTEAISLTHRGYVELEAKLAILKNKHLQVIDEMRRAAADKDFRENAPLEAAREQHGQLTGRIKDIEETLKSAIIVDQQQKVTLKVSFGDNIVLGDLDTGEELRYMIVSPRETDPTRSKISSASPIGKASIGRKQGDVVEVITPAGKLRYQIKQIER